MRLAELEKHFSDPNRWGKNSYECCLVGGIARITGVSPMMAHLTPEAIYLSTFLAPYWERNLIAFNDSPPTTHDDIIKLIRAARKKAKI